MSSIKVKVVRKSVTRAFPLQLTSDVENNVQELKKVVQQLCEISETTYFYVNEDGTKVPLSSQQDFENAVQNKKSLKIFVDEHFTQQLASDKENRVANRIKVLEEKLEKCQEGDKKRKIESLLERTKNKRSRLESAEPSQKLDKLEKLQAKLLLAKNDEAKKKIEEKIEHQKTKMASKDEKQKEKALKKEEKRIVKEQKQAERELISKDDIDLAQDLPANIKTVYLDGNNMLFVPQNLRDLTLKRNRSGAEKILNTMAHKFAQVSNLDLIHVMYDSTNHTSQENGFIVTSATPQFETSDDNLVEIANQAKNVHLDSCFFVTSDRGLRLRLKEIGAKCVKPKQWFQHAFDKINSADGNLYENLDEYLHSL